MDLIACGLISSVTRVMLLVLLVTISLATAHPSVRRNPISVQYFADMQDSGENTSTQQVDKLYYEKRPFARSFRQAANQDALTHNAGVPRRRLNEPVVDDVLKKVRSSILTFTLIAPGDSTRNGDMAQNGDLMQDANTFWKKYQATERRQWK